jgi:hypothetical protein
MDNSYNVERQAIADGLTAAYHAIRRKESFEQITRAFFWHADNLVDLWTSNSNLIPMGIEIKKNLRTFWESLNEPALHEVAL